MKKIISIIIGIFLITGCSSSTGTNEDSVKSETSGSETASSVVESAEQEKSENDETDNSAADDAMNDGVIDYQDEAFTIKLNNVEIGTDNAGRDILFAYFQFDNHTGDIVMPMECVGIEYFQNGAQLSSGVTEWSSDQMKELDTDDWTKVMDGASVEYVDYIELPDTSSPVTIMIQYKYMKGNKDLIFKEVDKEEVTLE